eukprot:scaffold45952_cov93-Phaeocystis_antarctica.AAC.5
MKQPTWLHLQPKTKRPLLRASTTPLPPHCRQAACTARAARPTAAAPSRRAAVEPAPTGAQRTNGPHRVCGRGYAATCGAGVNTSGASGGARHTGPRDLAQIGFRLGARPLGRVHRDEEARNGTNGSSTTSCLLHFGKSDLDTKLDEL